MRDQLDHPIEILGGLGTRYDSRNNLSKEVLATLREHFGEKLFKSVIPETVKLREAPSFGKPIFDHDPEGSGAKAYRKLAAEVVS